MSRPILERWWPLGLVGLGALAMLVLGDMPRSANRGQLAQANWVLPTGMDAGRVQVGQSWQGRQPWGSAAREDVSSSSVAAPQAQAVGVVRGALGLQALFEIPGQPLVRVREGDEIPGGGRVSRVSERQVDWTTADGSSRSRTLLTDPLPDTR